MSENNNEKYYIYVMFAHTTSKIGSLIRFITRHNYNHVSLSLEPDLHSLYSFARCYYNSPLAGGFVEESALRYTCFNAKTVPVIICAILSDHETYDAIIRRIDDLASSPVPYIYNTVSAVLTPFHRIFRIDKAFTCLEFVNYILDEYKLVEGINRNSFSTISDLESKLEKDKIYEGELSDFTNGDKWGNDRYYEHKPLAYVITTTIFHFGRLIYRILHRYFYE